MKTLRNRSPGVAHRRSLLIAALAFVSLMGTGMLAMAETQESTLFKKGLDLYKAKDYPAALQVFEKLRESGERTIADGSLLYVGRIYARTGRTAEANGVLRSLLERPDKSGRFREASYELALISFKAKDYLSVLPLLAPLEKAGNLEATDTRILQLLAQTRLALGTRYWRTYQPEDARANLLETIRLSEVLLAQVQPPEEEAVDAALQGEANAGLDQVASSADQHVSYRAAAEAALIRAIELTENAKEKERLQSILSDLRAQEQVKLQGSLEALGGANWAAVPGSSLLKPGVLLSADLSLFIPLAWRQLVVLNGGFTHDDFSLKTAYYPVGQPIDAARILERTDTFSLGVDWQAGSRRALFSDLKLTGAYTLAEIPADSSWDLRATERFTWRQSAAWRFGLSLDGQYHTFPGYTSSLGRDLDHYQAAAGPDATWYLSPDFNVNLGYDFTFRQYINAKYYLPSLLRSTLDKQYFTNAIGLTLRASPGTVVRPVLGYMFTYNTTINYDDKVIGLPAAKFVPGKGDYAEHRFRLGSKFDWTKDFSTSIEGSLAYRSYLNYLAQDTSSTFTGELRYDLDLHLDGEVQYVIWKQKANGFGDLVADLRVSYRDALSNHTFTGLVQANYQSFEVAAGAVLRLP